MLGGVDSFASFITVNEQSESTLDCNFYSSIASFASGRSYHQKIYLSTVTGVKWFCGGRKKSPRIFFLVQLSIPTGISGP